MVDLIGPAAAGATDTLTTTTDVTSPAAGDTWYQDCVDGSSGSGTPITAEWLNWVMQQLRVAIRMSGVPTANSYDNMLSWAMQSGVVNWASTGQFVGAKNALVAGAPNAPQAVEGGTLVCGIVSVATNDSAVTLNWAGLGAQPVKTADGVACAGGEVVDGAFLCVRWDGAAWRIVSPSPISWLLDQISGMDVQTFNTSGTWVAPAGYPPSSRVLIEIWEAGEGGSSYAGGEGGLYARYDSFLGYFASSEPVVVGAGGAAGTYQYPPTSAGTTSYFAYGSFGNALNSGGNTVGFSLNSTLPANAGGLGGQDSLTAGLANGQPSIWGGAGGAGASHSNYNGTAGTSVFGGNGGAAGQPGVAPGGGGGCAGYTASNTTYGQAGGNGRVVVTTFRG